MASGKVVPVEVVSLLTGFGLPHVAAFEQVEANGITDLKTFFVQHSLCCG